jgi:pimeloyl-ACP methyl ester carboxylesterase
MNPVIEQGPQVVRNLSAIVTSAKIGNNNGVRFVETSMKPFASRKHVALAFLFGVALLVGLQAPSHWQAGKLLTAMERGGPDPTSVRTIEASMPAVRGHWYVPSTFQSLDELQGKIPVVVIVHGLQYQGIDSKRLVNLAKSFSALGYAVYTPEIAELTDYKLDPKSVGTIRSAITYAQAKAARSRVGLFGVSFGAGLALKAAAADSDKLSFVGTLGGYGSAVRVSKFLVEGCADQVTGGCKVQTPHDYGTVIFFYDYASEFFSAEDTPVAQAALRHWLHEEAPEAKALIVKLSPEGQTKLRAIFDKQLTPMLPEVTRSLAKHKAELEAVSASLDAKQVRAPAFILHAAGDPVVPDTELGYLEAELPNVKCALTSQALGHAEIGKGGALDKAKLVHFMAKMLSAASD